MKPNTVPSKVPYISDLLVEQNQLIIALTETWLKTHKDAEVGIDGYQIFRSDRKRSKKSNRGRLSGGVAAYVRNDLACKMESQLNFSNGVVEILGLYSRTDNIYIAVIYRQPDDREGGNRSTAKEFLEVLDKLNNSLSKLPTPAPNLIICGDFNLPNTSWSEGSPIPGATGQEKEMVKALSDLSNQHFLKQHVVLPTHVDGNTLDLVFTNNDHLVHSCSTIQPLRSTSDHYVLEVATKYKTSISPENEEKPDFISELDSLNFFSNDINWDIISHDLENVNWTDEFNDLLPDEMLDRFMQILIGICTKHVPVRKSSIKSFSKIPRDRRILMKKRRKLSKQLSSAATKQSREKIEQKLVEIEISLQRSHKAASSRREQQAIKAIKTNSKFFFSYAKKYAKVNTGIGPLLDVNNEYTSSSPKMADILAKQYSSVFSSPLGQSKYTASASTSEANITDILFSVEDICDAIDELHNTSASGPDGIAAILMKRTKMSISKPLFTLWRACLDQGVTPASLKIAHIIPIHKGGHQGLAVNYRPIALTSHIIKIFEKVLRNKLVPYLESNNLFNPTQHGFRLGRSCLSQLLEHYDSILRMLEKGLGVDTIYLDFAKAFDKVDHQIVLEKLSILGIGGKIIKWIESFLISRSQHVIVNGFRSNPHPVISGVPQGSVIGPLLFLILIGDIDSEVVSSFLSTFADDTRVSKGIADEADITRLQTDLNSIYQWTNDNNMKLNDSKLELLRYGLNEPLRERTHYVAPDGSFIEEKVTVKDLGVQMSNDGSFTAHVNKITQSARDMCSWILRTFKSRSPEVMLTLWKTLVLPILDYCSQLWCPITPKQIKQIEAIQQSFTRKITLPSKVDYWERLSSFRLYSLQRRRERYRIIYTWKILEELVPNIGSEDNGGIRKLHSARNGRTCWIPLLPSSMPNKIQKLREASLLYHGGQLFNALPKQLRNQQGCSVLEFKRHLDKFLLGIEDKPLIDGYTAGRRAVSNSLLHMIPITSAVESQCNPPMNRGTPVPRW